MQKVKVDGSVIKFQERKDSTFALGEKALEATEQLSVHVMCTKAQAPLFNKTPLYILSDGCQLSRSHTGKEGNIRISAEFIIFWIRVKCTKT